MLQIQNETPFVAGLFAFPDPTGVDHLYLTVKATFSVTGGAASGSVSVAEKQLALIPGDEHWADPAETSLKFAGEAHPSKGATDILLSGHAYAPGGRPAPQFGVSLSVGSLKKTVAVFGDRVWGGGLVGLTPSAPQPTDKVPLVYERAFGGRHDLEKGFLAEMRNPVGLGFRGKRSAAEMKGTRLPNLEDPRRPIAGPGDSPAPTALGPIPPGWQPRLGYAGTYDEAWKKKRAPFFPDDFDARYFQVAPLDQIYPGFLRGGEPVELLNVSGEGPLRFSIPVCDLRAEVLIGEEAQRPPMNLETVLFEPDQKRFSLLWRGAVSCDKQTLKIKKAHLTLHSLKGASKAATQGAT